MSTEQQQQVSTFAQAAGDNQNAGVGDAGGSPTSFDQLDQAGSGQQQSQADNNGGFRLQVGDRVFTSEADVINHINHAQSHIRTIETENAGFRSTQEELNTLKGQMNELVQEIRATGSATQDAGQQHTQEQSSQTGPIDQKALVQEVAKTVQGNMQQEQQQTKQARNEASAIQRAQEKFGDDFYQKITDRAADLEMPMEDVIHLARNRPTAFRRIILEEAEQSPQSNGHAGVVKSSARALADGNVNNGQQNESSKGKNWMGMSSADKAADINRRIQELSGQ